MLHALSVALPGTPFVLDAGGSDASRGVALSRLPEVHSVLAPSPPQRVTPAGAPHSPPPAAVPTRVSPAVDPAPANAGSSGGTLASPAQAIHIESVPQVVVLNPVVGSPFTGTLPSKDRGKKRGRSSSRPGGVSVAIVVVLVVLALVAGFLCGWAVGRTT